MTGLAPEHLLACVVVPALLHIGADSPSARVLVLGTAMVESDLRYLKQIRGPALGLWQCEPRTHADIHRNYLRFKPPLANAVRALMVNADAVRDDELTWNLRYAAAICRVHYLRVKEPLPAADDAAAMAAYHKRYYNTSLGATIADRSAAGFEAARSAAGGFEARGSYGK